MFLIANNISTRNARVRPIFQQASEAGWKLDSGPAKLLARLGRQCAEAGADALEINLQQHFDRPEAARFAVGAVQQVFDGQLCLSANSPGALEAGIQACRRPPLVNYLSIDDVRLKEMLPLAGSKKAGVILLASEPARPADAREMLQKTSILIGAANEAGIPNDMIMVDPGLIHVTSAIGQRHLVEVIKFLSSLPEATEPPVKSTCWLANGSTGAARRLRPVIETALLTMLAGAGLSSVFLNVLQRPVIKAARLVKIFQNEVVYADSEIDF